MKALLMIWTLVVTIYPSPEVISLSQTTTPMESMEVCNKAREAAQSVQLPVCKKCWQKVMITALCAPL